MANNFAVAAQKGITHEMSTAKKTKNTAPKKNTNSKKGRKSNISALESAVPFIILAISLIFETCLILKESAGVLGSLIYALFFGLFGYAAHAVMISAILVAFFYKEYKAKESLSYKLIVAALTVISLSALNSVIAAPSVPDVELSLGQFWSSGVAGESGGVFGGIFGILISKIITPVGTAIVFSVIAVLSVSLLIGKSRLGLWQIFSKQKSDKDSQKPKAKVQAPSLKTEPSATRIDSVIGENAAELSVPELVGNTADFSDADFEEINYGLGTGFSVSDGKHTIETVDFDKPEQTAKPYKSEDLMEKFGFKEPVQQKSDVYDETPKTQENQPARKINIGTTKSYSPFASVVSEQEFFSSENKEQPTVAPKPETRAYAYSPFADPVRSMHDHKKETAELPPQTYAANDEDDVWQKMQTQASALEEQSAPQTTPEQPYESISLNTAPYVEEEFEDEPIEIEPTVEVTDVYEQEQPQDEPITVLDISALNKTGISDFDEVIPEPEQEEKPAPARPIFTPPAPPKPAPAPVADGEDHGINPFGVYNKLRYPKYVLPSTSLLDSADGTVGISENEIYETQKKLIEILESFGINATLTGYSIGPTITRYELTPGAGVKFKHISNLSEDISVRLQSDKLKSGIRIVTVPGKSVIGVEVPNSVVKKVALRSMIEEPAFKNAKSKITVCVGLSVSGKPVYMNIDDMPHVLVAGQTKSGKSVAINCMIMSLIYRATPDDVQLLLIDPKRVELSIYNNLPHLVMPVIDDPKKAAAALKWAVDEMDRRYTLLNEAQVRNRDEYYEYRNENPKFEYMPQIVIIIDELADLMLQAKEHVEGRINRLAAMARACGMHIVIGTQRPSVDVVTGLIKANIPSHIAFKVASQTDSRVILNVVGAEKLLGRGDMLYHETGKDIVRLQGAFVDTPEIKRVLNFIIDNNGKAVYNPEVMYALQQETDKLNKSEKKGSDEDLATDCSDIDFELLCQATELVIQMGGGISKNVIQRHLKIGFNRSANIFDKLEELGFISPPQGNKPRDCTVTWEQYQQWRNNNGK